MKRQMVTFTSVLVLLLTTFLLPPNAINKTDSVRVFKGNNAAPSSRRIIYVPDEFESIQVAINNSADGDVILVSPGTYKEKIVIDRSIFLIGMNQTTTILDGERKSDVVTINADNVALSGFTIKNGNFPARFGVHINNNISASVQHNIIVNNFVGVKLNYTTSNKIKWNHLSNNRYGIFLAHSSQNVVYANNVSDNGWNGIELDWSSQNLIEANTISLNGAYGLEIPFETPAQNNVIFHNNFFNNSLGVRVSSYMNVWSYDYPVGGNFWGSHVGVDVLSGANQDQPGSDGIIDLPYRIDQNAIDKYPLATRFSPLPPRTPKVNLSFSPVKPFLGDNVTFSVSMSAPQNESDFSYFWSFGDGSNGQGAATTHVYDASGAFLVNLYVIDHEEGLLTTESTIVIIEAQFSNVATYVVIGISAIAIVVAFAYLTKIKKFLAAIKKKRKIPKPYTSEQKLKSEAALSKKEINSY